MFNKESFEMIAEIAEYRVHVEVLLEVFDNMIKAGYEPTIEDGKRVDTIREILKSDTEKSKSSLDDVINQYIFG